MADALDKKLAAAQWYLNLRETNNQTFLPLFFDQHRFLVLKGGGGSGKSIFAGRKILERAITEPGHRILVCRKVAKSLRQSCWQQLIGQLGEHYADVRYRVNRTDMTISFPDSGSEILFSGLDDVEKLKSIYRITSIWIEEASEITEGDLNQLDIRLRDETTYYKQIILSFNPISVTHWLKRRFWDDQNDPKKWDWRVRTHESTYRDNRFLTQDQVDTLEAFKGKDDYYYSVYALGQWGVTGKTVFPAQIVSERLAQLTGPIARGSFRYEDTGKTLEKIQWTDTEDGEIQIYKLPEAGAPYVLGGDTAGEGSDWFVGQVLDNRTGEQVATLRLHTDEDLYARLMYCLGRYYNWALIGIEANWSTHPILELERLKYPKQYVRETYDDFTHETRRSYGWWTSTRNRNTIIAELVQAVRDDPTAINDRTTLEEMLTFVRGESWKPEAEDGAHDDCVMALAITHAIRDQQSYTSKQDKTAQRTWTRAMWEDYRQSDRAGRAYLRSVWGEPTKVKDEL